jgi:protein subunit release factor A
MQFRDRLDQTEVRFEELTRQLADPVVIGDSDQYRKAAKAHSELSEIVSLYREWKKLDADLGQARSMMNETEPELQQMAAEKWRALSRTGAYPGRAQDPAASQDPNDEERVLDSRRHRRQATLFAASFPYVSRYAEAQSWKIDVTSSSDRRARSQCRRGERPEGFSKLKYKRRAVASSMSADRAAGARACFRHHGGRAARSRRVEVNSKPGRAHRAFCSSGPADNR